MERPHRFERLVRRIPVPTALRELPNRLGPVLSGRGAPFFRRAVGIAWVGVAGVLAWYASEAAEARALSRWTQENAPSVAIWNAALDPQGYVALDETDRLHRVLKSLPSLVEDRASVWMTSDAQWIALFPSPGEGTADPGAPRIFGKVRGEYFAPRILEAPTRRRGRAVKTQVHRVRTPWPSAPRRDAWLPLGTGWAGWSAVMKRLESIPATPLISQKEASRSPHRAKPAGDPRSILY